ncbi:MAG TPA: UMP kinase [Candidatus Kapabacteria bacterium]|nr:UMP kinase [Candidatus Kapabacteria bacterium]
MKKPVYNRVLLKLSGESLMGDAGYGIDPKKLVEYAEEIESIHKLGVQVGVVIGGGNIYRGIDATAAGIKKVSGDYMGMLATVINGVALQNALEVRGIFTRLMSAITMEQIAEPYIRRRAVRHLEKNRVVIFAAGTGNPYFTTDTAAVLRGVEIEAEVILKATRVDGIYDADPERIKDANYFPVLTYRDVLEKNLRVMDMTAITLCQENALPIVVFNVNVSGNLQRVILGEHVGSIVTMDKVANAAETARVQ